MSDVQNFTDIDMKKIKVAQVITRMDWGGSPDVIRILCKRFDTKICDVRLICGPTARPSEKTRVFFQNFRDNIFYISHLRRNINIYKDFLAVINLYHLFREEKFDIVHTHTAKAGLLGRIAAWLAGVPFIIHSPHGHNFYGYFGPFLSKIIVILERFVSCFTSKIIVSTKLEKEDLVSFKVARPEKIVVFNSGVELENYKDIVIDSKELRNQLKLEKDKPIVGMIGRLEPVKGPQYFIEAAKLVIENFPEVAFLIIGEGSLRNELEMQCKNANILERIVFTGWREDIPELLSTIEILALPSLNEAVGRILIEAGASGVPVVASNVGGVPQIVNNNQTGILVPPKDPYAMAQAIVSLLKDKEKRKKMGQAAQKWVDIKFSTHTMFKQISNLYRDLVTHLSC